MTTQVCAIHPIVKSVHFHNRNGLIGIPGQYSYRINTTGGSSDKYGKCEVCGKHAPEVFIQTQLRYYVSAVAKHFAGMPFGGWTAHNCSTLFGHRECLESRQITAEATR